MADCGSKVIGHAVSQLAGIKISPRQIVRVVEQCCHIDFFFIYFMRVYNLVLIPAEKAYRLINAPVTTLNCTLHYTNSFFFISWFSGRTNSLRAGCMNATEFSHFCGSSRGSLPFYMYNRKKPQKKTNITRRPRWNSIDRNQCVNLARRSARQLQPSAD